MLLHRERLPVYYMADAESFRPRWTDQIHKEQMSKLAMDRPDYMERDARVYIRTLRRRPHRLCSTRFSTADRRVAGANHLAVSFEDPELEKARQPRRIIEQTRL